MTTVDTVVVGAGQAGLAMSYFLQRDGRSHLVLERGRIGESWCSQRWDSFKLNTPNFMNSLPGLPFDAPEPDGFSRCQELVDYFRRYVDHFGLPVRTDTAVVSVEREEGEDCFRVKTRAEGQAEATVLSRSVVVAAGVLHTSKIPPLSSRLPDGITQLHTSGYRSEATLPAGAIVIVGSGQSGCQIAEDLLAAGRKVYLCTGKAGRIPRRYRGRDMLEWWIDTKYFQVPYAALADKSVSLLAQPQISGLGRYGHTLSLQSLAQQSAVILGRLLDVDGSSLVLSDEAAAHVRFADEFSQQRKAEVDAYLLRAGITPPPLESDPADAPDLECGCVSPLRRLDLGEANVSTVIWATGFSGDFRWLRLPVLDPDGKPLHKAGISPVRGLYFLGFPWLVSRQSGIIYGVQTDAAAIAGEIAKQLG